MRLSAIYRYPLKSARGEALRSARLDAFGIAGDRRWMLVDANGEFVSQRQLAVLALLGARTDGAGLQLAFAGERREFAPPAAQAPRVTVDIWGDRVPALTAGAAANAWISRCTGRQLRLVYLPEDAQRHADPDYAPAGQRVAFSDGFPLLVVTQASLDDLNTRLERPVPMDRFRPNLVIDGATPFAEDGWRRLRIGDTVIELVKPCSRCVIPSIDQATGGRDAAINRVLAGYRRRGGVVYFGMNALGPAGARLAVADKVAVLH